METHEPLLLVVDRIEGQTVVLEGARGGGASHRFEVPRSAFRIPVPEGAVLRVPAGGAEPDWGLAKRDRNEERRRVRDLKQRMERLTAKDDGGDVAL
jgi:hypothetical protein